MNCDTSDAAELESLLSRYDYPVSPEMIAMEPASPRDSSKLLIFERRTKAVRIDAFRNLAKHLPKGALLIFNNTKVLPARIPGTTVTGGRVELLCTSFSGVDITALCERRLETGDRIQLTRKIFAVVKGKIASEYQLHLSGTTDVRAVFKKIGITPLPPYLKHSQLSESERRKKYQSVFAKNDGSIAAPTASLHFTPRVFASLKNAHIETAYVTLHVNLGTFMPLTEKAFARGELHEEMFAVPTATAELIRKAKAEGRPVIPVGTTALRTIESHALGMRGSTKLFITEGFTFQVADGLITNFHVPRSSLMMLVSALTGREKLLELYAYAAKHNLRFFSFGDAMLIV